MDSGLVIPDLEEYYRKGTFYSILDKLQNEGIKNIEIHASLLLNKTEQKLSKLKEDFKSRNISIVTVHAPFGIRNDLSSFSLIQEEAQ